MSLTLITPPAALPVSLQEVRAQCRLEDASEDAMLVGYIRSAVSWIDGHEGWLGRQLITATYDYTFDAFPWGYHSTVRLPLPPVQAVISITYIDGHGVTQVLDPVLYHVGSEYLWPAYGQTWPTTRYLPAAVTVRFTSGYGDNWNSIPEAIRQALMMLVAYWYSQREAASVGDHPISDIPFSVRQILEPYRVRPV
jgi:uncharacterized phiE125 gp8 family phage protein